MDLRSEKLRRICLCFPRRRGDGPVADAEEQPPDRFPPQARGWTGHRNGASETPDVSPAGAGMDLVATGERLPRHCFPRRRGDGPLASDADLYGDWFPPQARGWTGGTGDRRLEVGVSPAGAGMDPFQT